MTNNPTTNTIETQKKEGEPKPYYITVEDLMKFEFGDRTPETNTKLQTNTGKDAAREKCNFMISQGFAIPDEWYIGSEDGFDINPKFIACISTLYTLISRTKGLKELQYNVANSNINDAGLSIILETLNLWLDSRLETDQKYRQDVQISGRDLNPEEFWRENGSPVNTDGKVNEVEMQEIMQIYRAKFKK